MKFRELLESARSFKSKNGVLRNDLPVIADHVSQYPKKFLPDHFYFVGSSINDSETDGYVLIKIIKNPTYIRYYFKIRDLPDDVPLDVSLNDANLSLIAKKVPPGILMDRDAKRTLLNARKNESKFNIHDFLTKYVDLACIISWDRSL